MNAPTTCAASGLLKPVLGGALGLVAIGAIVFGVMREVGKSDAARSTPPASSGSPTSAAPTQTTVYYFHGETRCETCLLIEKQTTELVQRAFAEDIAAGRVRFRVVNYDEPADRHFRDDFKLPFGSVVVSTGDKWENLGDVWKLVHDDRAAFDDYLISRIEPFAKASR